MFTGLVEEIGRIISIQKGVKSSHLTIQGDIIFNDLSLGDSVAVNGVCLTAVKISEKTFTTDVMSETINRSALGLLKSGSFVNLERAMKADGRFGGHMVSGHIDGIGELVQITKEDIALWYTIKTTEKIMHYIIEKGSVTIDGISLTVADTGENTFRVSVIPHTAKNTILSHKKIGDIVNLENDIAGKYIEKFLLKEPPKPDKITKEFLLQSGFL